MTYKIPMILVSPILDESNAEIGKQYIDSEIECEDVFDFLVQIETRIASMQSIILYRQDVKRFALRIERDFEDSTSVFKKIKCNLRSKFTVFKLRHNPRTLEFYGINTAFIIHKAI